MSPAKPQHTPGPWSSCQLGKGILVGPTIAGKIGNVAVVYGSYGESAANVALIAAAPDLLGFAERYLHRCDRAFGTDGPAITHPERSLWEEACAALAKAGGK